MSLSVRGSPEVFRKDQSIRASLKFSAPVVWDVVGMSKEDTTVNRARPPYIFSVDGCGEGVDGKSFGICIAIAKQQEPVVGFADDFGVAGDVVPNLLHRELFVVGHGGDNFSTGF